MKTSLKIKVAYDKIPEYSVKVNRAANKAALKTALDTQRRIKRNIKSVGAVRTGYMRDSVYANVGPSKAAVSAGKGVISVSSGPRVFGEVGVGADYAYYVEYGTSKMKARPFFRPAIDEMERTFARNIRDIKNIKV